MRITYIKQLLNHSFCQTLLGVRTVILKEQFYVLNVIIVDTAYQAFRDSTFIGIPRKLKVIDL